MSDLPRSRRPRVSVPAPARARILALICPAAALTLIALGCGSDPNKPELAQVSGKITYKGEPLPGATVTFSPTSGPGAKTGQAATGQTDASGYYRLGTFTDRDGVVVGDHKVIVVANEGGPDVGKVKPDGTIDYRLGKSLIPLKYSDPLGTPLTAAVKSGSQTIDFDLTD